MTTPPLRTLIADDQEAVRSSVQMLLDDADGFEVVGTAADGSEAVDLALSTRPDVILMDIRMPGTDGVAATRAIFARWPNASVVVHSAYGDDSLVIDALEAGARGYVLKGAPAAEMVKALRSVAAGRSHITDDVLRPLIERLVTSLGLERQTRLAAEQAAERLERVTQRQQAFALMSSHELRTPLTVMVGALELLADEGNGGDGVREELLWSALHGARRLRRLAENLEVTASAETLTVRGEPVVLADAVGRVVADLKVDVRLVDLKIPRDLVVHADRKRLEQVTSNLVSNALAVSAKNERVDVTGRRSGDAVIFEIRDRGIGFETTDEHGVEAIDRAEPFRYRPGAVQGLGLGLWVARQLVELMAGDLWAANNAGGGATVTVRLPTARNPGPSEPVRSSRSRARR